jgi:hypothetical protein
VGFGDVGGFVAEGCEKGIVLAGELRVECGGDGVGEGEGGTLWKRVPASRWARTRHRKVGGEEPRDMIDSMGHWLYAVAMEWMCILAMWLL